MKDLQHLPAKEIGELLALAAVAIRTREAQRPTMIQVHLAGPVTPAALHEAARGLIAQRRRDLGMAHVDVVELSVRDD